MKYACQNKTQVLLDHMYPTPEHFQVAPQYLYGLGEDEFIDGFRCLWNVVKDMYNKIPESAGI